MTHGRTAVVGLRAIVLGLASLCAVLSHAAFQDQTAQLMPGLADSPSAWGDYDNDGYRDIFVLSGSSRVMRSLAGSGFAAVPLPALPTTDNRGASWADFGGDGYVDQHRNHRLEAGADVPCSLQRTVRSPAFHAPVRDGPRRVLYR